MEPGQITAAVVKDALRVLRYGGEEALESPLLALHGLALHLRDEDLIDTPDNRRFRLRRFLHGVIVQERTAIRTGAGQAGAADGPPANRGDLEQERRQLEADYRVGNRKLEAWAMLEQRYFPLDEEETGKEVAKRLGITVKTITRRLAKGHELLAEWLRENEASAAQALGRRPGAAAADRVAVVGDGKGDGAVGGAVAADDAEADDAEASSVDSATTASEAAVTTTAAETSEAGDSSEARDAGETGVAAKGAGRATRDDASAATPPPPETAAAVVKLLATIRDDEAVLELTPREAKAVASTNAADPQSYRLSRFATWAGPGYALDRTFVSLSLLIDQGEQATERFMAKEARYDDLGALIAEVDDPALVVLGAPGSGKSTLLRRLEMDASAAGLRGETEALTFFVRLSGFGSHLVGSTADMPEAWLAEEWQVANPAMPPLEQMLQAGPMLLLLDGLNEMPHESARAYHERVVRWKLWLQAAVRKYTSLRVVFSCRSLDYSRTLSSEDLRVPQVQVEPMSDEQIERYLKRRVPASAKAVWSELERRGEVDAVRTPFFLRLLADQVAATGELLSGRAALMSQFVRLALRREVEKDTPLFRPNGLLSEIDFQRLSDSRTRWEPVWELPEDGALIPSFTVLADGMQRAQRTGEGSLVRVSYRDALDLLPPGRGRDVIRAGATLSVLEELPGREVGFLHQLVQEYFAARRLARNLDPGLVASPWRAADMDPPLEDVLDTLDPSEALPALEQTGWEETALLAAAMEIEPAGFLQAVSETNLVLAARCAAQPEVRPRVPAGLLDELRVALIERTEDPAADLRHRIACGYVLGDLGDPRFERCEGPHGAYLMPPLVKIPAGRYPIGDDEPIAWAWTGGSGTAADHVPRHEVEIDAFRIGRFPVTNAEWACFMAAGGYEDERWWDTADARRWQRGELANVGNKANGRYFRARFLEDANLFEQMVEEGRFPNDEALERWRGWMALDDEAFEAALDEQWQARQETEPQFWRDAQYNHAEQPAVGVCWYEARAYCAWLGATSGLDVRLPTEAEWEASARGTEARAYAFGDTFDPLSANTVETHVKGTTPVGVFPDGRTPRGVADLSGNVYEWTSSLFGKGEVDDYETEYPYPYDPWDGREDGDAGPNVRRVVRGGGWLGTRSYARAAFRLVGQPVDRYYYSGLRVVVASSPILGL